MSQENIRNFCILAHIDHGKSTLADRFLELTGTVEKRKMQEQFLDMHPLEREKGITIKMQPVRMIYHPHGQLPATSNQLSAARSWKPEAGSKSNAEYILNLIDTPGHVDFTYEVSRALAAVEGGILLVDAAQGVQAQTLANLHLAQKENLIIIPAINKIDLPSAEIERAENEIMSLLPVGRNEIYKISAKTGEGVENLLQAVIKKFPPPTSHKLTPSGSISSPSGLPTHSYLRGLIFDSKFDSYQGVIAYVRIFDGTLAMRGAIRFLTSAAQCEALEVGVFKPERAACALLSAGEIGYVATGIKEPEKVRVGDTITKIKNQKSKIKSFELENYAEEDSIKPLPGYKEPMPMVYASLMTENQDEFETLRDALKKLKLEDAALSFEPEESSALGRGFRTGFLGMLHMEIIAERLRREYNLEIVFSSPSVAFRIRSRKEYAELKKDNEDYYVVYSAYKMPPPHEIDTIEEPYALVEIITPPAFLGSLTSLINERGGLLLDTTTLSEKRLSVRFRAPLREIIVDFYDELKSLTRGYASMAYELGGYKRADLVRLDILVAGDLAPTLSEILPREKTYSFARARLLKLKDLLPRELFAVALQATVEGKIIARETIPAMKKDVTGYLYGGDRTRKMKLWKKQQRGKKRLKEAGHVQIPTDVFLKMFKR